MNDRKMMIHIGVEAVVIAGLAFVTNRRNNELLSRISQLEEVVIKQAEALALMKRHLSSLETANSEKDKQMEMFATNVSSSFNVLQQEMVMLKERAVPQEKQPSQPKQSSQEKQPSQKGQPSLEKRSPEKKPSPVSPSILVSRPLEVSPPAPLFNNRNNPIFPPVSIRIISQKTEMRKTVPKVEVISEEEDVDEKEIEDELAELTELEEIPQKKELPKAPLQEERQRLPSDDEEHPSPLNKAMSRSPPPLHEIEA